MAGTDEENDMETPILLTPTIAIQFFLVFFLGMCVIKLIFSLPRKKVDLGTIHTTYTRK